MVTAIRRRELDLGTLLVPAVAAAAIALSAFLGYAAPSLGSSKAEVVVLVLIGVPVLSAIAQRPWGSVGVVAPSFLFAFGRPFGGLQAPLLMGLVTAVIAWAYWAGGAGRPRISIPATVAVAISAGACLLATYYDGRPLQQGFGLTLLWFSGLLLGTCVANQEQGRIALGLFALPLCALAGLEALGVNNFWPSLTGGSRYVDVSLRDAATRSQSTFGHPLIAGACLATIGALFLQGRSSRRFLLLLPIIAAVFTTVSRSALLGLAAAGTVAVLGELRVSARRAAALLLLLVVAVGAVLSIPSVKTSFESRVINTTEQQDVRETAFREFREQLEDDPGSLLIGQGFGSTKAQLEARGGINGLFAYDNQYVTGAREIGLLPMLATALLILWALAAAGPARRRAGLPVLIVPVVVMAFVDGGYWLSLSVVAGLALGYATAPPEARRRSASRAGRYPNRLASGQ